MKVPFWKLTGAGNDFVLLEGLPRGRSGAALARRLCDRRFGIGADGLLVVSRSRQETRLLYWNADGSASFCGNGTRCAALWTAARGRNASRSFPIRTNRGLRRARLTGRGRAEVTMPWPRDLRLDLSLKLSGRAVAAHFVDTGVPHCVVFVPDVDSVDVRTLGRALRFHPAFGKAGANVDFVTARRGALTLRTYERGVEDETLACGTGIVASAVVARAMGLCGPRARVRVRGGETLIVGLGTETTLEGPGKTVFAGEVEL
jgi:diaminopimelate epimerase